MILYQATKSVFLGDLEESRIDQLLVDGFRRRFRQGVSPAEVGSWRNSLQYVGNVLRDPAMPNDLGVSVECQIPRSSKRIDVILTGHGAAESAHAVILELKQWERAARTDMDAMVRTFLGGGERETIHPSYQAWCYAQLLEQFNQTVQQESVVLHPCAFLHNCSDAAGLRDPFYKEHLERAPVFTRHEVSRLRGFIRQFILHGDHDGIMRRIERSPLRPSRKLSDAVVGMLEERPEFVLVDEQKEVFEKALRLVRLSETSGKQVMIVHGGPGTGKSVVAINLVARLIGEGRFAQYVSKNSAPRAVYSARLAGRRKVSEISGLFCGSGSYIGIEPDSCQCLVVDEAHRLNEKSGLYGNLGENQIREIIQAARCTVFFVDENQQVTLKDIGMPEDLRKWSDRLGAQVTEMRLESQFRCQGSDAYLSWLDRRLGIRDEGRTDLEGAGYDFRVFDDPSELRAAIEARNQDNGARLVAGYCWPWKSKKDPATWDIEFPGTGFRARWNLASDGSLWIVQPGSVSEVGCIHTCQGLEVDHVGVIIGPDLVMRDGRLATDATARAGSDKSVHGWRQRAKRDPEGTAKLTDRIIRNTYRTLMTRGTKGCYVYAVDPGVRKWLRDGPTPTA
jgi:uncharacterized protein